MDWHRQWYPVALLDYLDPKVPHPIQLLGERLVLWRDAQHRWRCFEDKCPHRLAPLSGLSVFWDVHHLRFQLFKPNSLKSLKPECHLFNTQRAALSPVMGH